MQSGYLSHSHIALMDLKEKLMQDAGQVTNTKSDCETLCSWPSSQTPTLKWFSWVTARCKERKEEGRKRKGERKRKGKKEGKKGKEGGSVEKRVERG